MTSALGRQRYKDSFKLERDWSTLWVLRLALYGETLSQAKQQKYIENKQGAQWLLALTVLAEDPDLVSSTQMAAYNQF